MIINFKVGTLYHIELVWMIGRVPTDDEPYYTYLHKVPIKCIYILYKVEPIVL